MAQTTGAKKGSLFVLKIETAPSTFTTIGGLRSNTLTINAQNIDVTSKDSNGWRELIDADIKSMSVSGSGVYKNGVSDELVIATVMAAQSTPTNFQLVNSSGDAFEGPFLITSYEKSGDNDGAEMYSVTLDSAGVVEYNLGT